mgnify:CR=1 FL=1
MPNHHPKPEPIQLGTARTTYATAYANRPPTNRLSCWSYFSLNKQSDPSSQSKCRFYSGHDPDVGYNDTVHGILCIDYDGTQRKTIRHKILDGYFIMGR